MRESQKPIVDKPTDNFILPVNAKKYIKKIFNDDNSCYVVKFFGPNNLLFCRRCAIGIIIIIILYIRTLEQHFHFAQTAAAVDEVCENGI